MRRLEVRLDWGPQEIRVGTLGEQDRRIHFEFDRAFLEAPLPISPIHLKPGPDVYAHTDRAFNDVFGVFHDSLPDGWGMLLMDRHLRKQGLDLMRVTALDRLAYIGIRGMGALTYHPPEDLPEVDPLVLDLRALADQSARILQGSPEDLLPALRIAGGSPGGARPKVLAAYHEGKNVLLSGAGSIPLGFQPLLIKFAAEDDGEDIGAVEYAYAQMAQAAGIGMPPVRLLASEDDTRYFAVERFDRVDDARRHVHTLGGLLHASHREPSLDYDHLLRVTLFLTKDHRQVEEAFRRAAFNVFAHNRDDHSKNFSFVMDREGLWQLAPAYDLVFSHGINGWHSTSIVGEAENPTEADLRRLAETFSLERRVVDAVLEQVRDAVAGWETVAHEAGVSPERIGNIQDALAKI